MISTYKSKIKYQKQNKGSQHWIELKKSSEQIMWSGHPFYVIRNVVPQVALSTAPQ